VILYEYPFNEKIRTYLRLEHQFARLFTLLERLDALDHHFALITLFEPGTPRAEVGFSQAAPVDRWLHAHRKTVLWAFGLSMLGSIALLPFVQFDFNPLHLRDPTLFDQSDLVQVTPPFPSLPF
jgi:hypothetical protein